MVWSSGDHPLSTQNHPSPAVFLHIPKGVDCSSLILLGLPERDTLQSASSTDLTHRRPLSQTMALGNLTIQKLTRTFLEKNVPQLFSGTGFQMGR
jgi:hypothetical protein